MFKDFVDTPTPGSGFVATQRVIPVKPLVHHCKGADEFAFKIGKYMFDWHGFKKSMVNKKARALARASISVVRFYFQLADISISRA
jgi:hypothetical protein